MVKILFTFIITVYHLKCKAVKFRFPKYTVFLIHMRIPHIILISNALSALLSHVKHTTHTTGTPQTRQKQEKTGANQTPVNQSINYTPF